MAYTADQLRAKIAALEAALDRHVLQVDYVDRSVRYRSFQEIREAIDYYKTQLSEVLATESGRTRKQFRGYATKGL